MTPARKAAAIAGGLYLLTFVTSIPAYALTAPALDDPTTIGTVPGVHDRLLWAGLLEVVLALACIGTAVALFPIAKRVSETAALGFIAARVLEAAIIVVGVAALLSLASVRTGGTATSEAVDTALVAAHDWAFLLGPGLIPAVNAALLGYVMYRGGLVPRIIPLLGLVGSPLLAASATLTLFGHLDQVSPAAALAALPVAAWELALGIWLILKGVSLPGSALAAAGEDGRLTGVAKGQRV